MKLLRIKYLEYILYSKFLEDKISTTYFGNRIHFNPSYHIYYFICSRLLTGEHEVNNPYPIVGHLFRCGAI